VPGNTGAPLITSGDALTTELLITDTINQCAARVQKASNDEVERRASPSTEAD
jgi:hypothetical protein